MKKSIVLVLSSLAFFNLSAAKYFNWIDSSLSPEQKDAVIRFGPIIPYAAKHATTWGPVGSYPGWKLIQYYRTPKTPKEEPKSLVDYRKAANIAFDHAEQKARLNEIQNMKTLLKDNEKALETLEQREETVMKDYTKTRDRLFQLYTHHIPGALSNLTTMVKAKEVESPSSQEQIEIVEIPEDHTNLTTEERFGVSSL